MPAALNRLPLTIAERQDQHERDQAELARAHNALAAAVATLAEQLNGAMSLLQKVIEPEESKLPTREPFKRHKGH